MAAGCTEDPWAFAPPVPGVVDREEQWAWSVRGTVVGQEERTFGADESGHWAHVRTTFAFRESAGDTGRPESARERWVRRVATVRCGAEPVPPGPIAKVMSARKGAGGDALEAATSCSGERWTADGVRERLTGTCAPEWLGVPEGLCVPLGGVATQLYRDGDVVRFSRPVGDLVTEVRVGLDGAGFPAWIESGGLRGERVSEPVELHPVDVAALTAQPVERMSNARGSRVGEYRVAGVSKRIEVPTSAELPSRDVARLSRLVEQVADALPGDASCKEHASALVDAARMAGYPSRPVFGRVYTETAAGPALVLHAWAEVEVHGRWVGADSAFGQFPADASHVPLATRADELVAIDDEITIVALR